MTDEVPVVRTVPVAAEIVRTTRPHIPPARHCKVCGVPAAPGSYWCRDCRGTHNRERRES